MSNKDQWMVAELHGAGCLPEGSTMDPHNLRRLAFTNIMRKDRTFKRLRPKYSHFSNIILYIDTKYDIKSDTGRCYRGRRVRLDVAQPWPRLGLWGPLFFTMLPRHAGVAVLSYTLYEDVAHNNPLYPVKYKLFTFCKGIDLEWIQNWRKGVRGLETGQFQFWYNYGFCEQTLALFVFWIPLFFSFNSGYVFWKAFYLWFCSQT